MDKTLISKGGKVSSPSGSLLEVRLTLHWQDLSRCTPPAALIQNTPSLLAFWSTGCIYILIEVITRGQTLVLIWVMLSCTVSVMTANLGNEVEGNLIGLKSDVGLFSPGLNSGLTLSLCIYWLFHQNNETSNTCILRAFPDSVLTLHHFFLHDEYHYFVMCRWNLILLH